MFKRKRLQKFLSACLLIVSLLTTSITAEAKVVTVVEGISAVKANTSSTSSNYHSSWQYWSAGASKYSWVRNGGCRIVSYSKLIKEAGFAAFNNPDDFYEWGLNNGHYVSGYAGEQNAPGEALKDYVEQQGGTVTYQKIPIDTSKTRAQICEDIMGYLRNGYYVILCGSEHFSYVGREASLDYGEPVMLDSWMSWSYSPYMNVTYSGYNDATFTNYRIFSVNGSGTSGGTTGVTGQISYDNVYVKSVTDTTASVRADVTANANMYKEAGIYWGTTSDTTQKVGFDTSNNSKLTFIEVAFDGSEGPTLSRGTRYYYRFYAIRNDGTIDVDPTVRSFVTTGDSTSPQINSAWVQDTNGEGYTVVCTVSDDVAVDRVCCPTWTEANGQDDLFTDWYNTAVATKISDNTYTYRVNAADHNNEWGKYITHVYAYDPTGNQVNVELTKSIYLVDHTLTSEFPLVDGGIYKIRSVGSNKVIDVPSGSSDNSVVLHQWENCAAESQKWKAVKLDDGYAFISVNSGKAMTIVDDSPYGEVRLTQNEYKASEGQTFKLIHRGDGKYAIHPVCSDMVLDVNGASTDNGAEIMQYFYFGSDNQLWTFDKWDAEKPVISNVKIKNVTVNGFDVTCTVSDNVGISNVCFPTWTEANGQDDLVDDWYYNATATSVSGNVYTYHVDVTDHNNESGKYFTDIYAYDTSGNYVISNCTIEVPGTEVDPLEAFVTRMYQQCLSRDPDQSGLDGWVGQLRGGYMNGADIAEQFVFSNEMLEKNLSNEEFVNILYRAMMGREADAAGRTGWVNELNNGYLTRSEVTKCFVESTEFTNICSEYGITRGTYDASMAPIEHFVTRFYTLCLERDADQKGLYGWVNNLKNQYMNGAQIAEAFIFSDEFVGKNVSDEKYVELLYNTLLGRQSDASGKAGWVGELQGGYMTREGMMKAFIESTEFTGICEKYGITRGTVE